MAIIIDEVSHPGFFASRHFIAYSLDSQRHVIVRSGIFLLPNESESQATQAGRSWTPAGFRGTSSSTWRGEQFRLSLDLQPSINRLNPPPPSEGRYWAFDMDQWAPVASLNSIYNAEVSTHAGSSVNTCVIRQPKPAIFIDLVMDVAVRDSDGFLYRIGYYVMLVGRLVQVDIPVVE
jgi:hypothetical protein